MCGINGVGGGGGGAKFVQIAVVPLLVVSTESFGCMETTSRYTEEPRAPKHVLDDQALQCWPIRFLTDANTITRVCKHTSKSV